MDFTNAESLWKRGLRAGKSLDFPNPCDKEKKSHTDWILLTQNLWGRGKSMLKFEEETKRILNACLEVHNELGCGFLEPVYQEALEREFRIEKIPFEREKLLPILYKGQKLDKNYFADFICFNEIILEIKAVSTIAKAHKAQVINYLKAANKQIGLLVNFGCNSLKWERISHFEE